MLKVNSPGSICGKVKLVGESCTDPAECVTTECDPNEKTCTFTCKGVNEQCLSAANCCEGLSCGSQQNLCCRGPGTLLPPRSSNYECCSGTTQSVQTADGGTLTLCN